MKQLCRIRKWVAFRLFNIWHTVGFLFKPFLTIGVCLILTVLLNALLFLVMQWLPEESTLYSLIYALITGVTASFFASICIEFSNNYRSNRMRALELSEYFGAVFDYEISKDILMHPKDPEYSFPAMDELQVVWYHLPTLMPILQKTYEEKKEHLSLREAESLKLILMEYEYIKRDFLNELQLRLRCELSDVPVSSLPDDLLEALPYEYTLDLRMQEWDRMLQEIVDRRFDSGNILKKEGIDWMPVSKKDLADEESENYLLSLHCRNILNELMLLEKPILKQPGFGAMLREVRKASKGRTAPKEKPMKKPWYLRKWVWIAAALVLIIGVPLAINGLYLANGPIKTRWDAEHVLAYYGEILSFAGTVVLGIVAVWQTQKANDLSKRMLELEEYKNLPMVDLCQINEIPSDLPAGTYQNSLSVTAGGGSLAMKKDNTILHSNGGVLAFMLKNVSDTYITSLEVEDVQYVAYKGGQPVRSQGSGTELRGGIRSFAVGDAQYFLIDGVDTCYDLGDLSEEESRKCVLRLEITFLLGNTQGKKYREMLRIGYYPTREENGILYPQILQKDPVKIVPEE